MVTRRRIDRLLSIQEIKANPRNARTHSQAQIRQIAESIKAFGFGDPVLVDETLTLIGGYGRLKAAERLNIAEIPAVQLVGRVAILKSRILAPPWSAKIPTGRVVVRDRGLITASHEFNAPLLQFATKSVCC